MLCFRLFYLKLKVLSALLFHQIFSLFYSRLDPLLQDPVLLFRYGGPCKYSYDLFYLSTAFSLEETVAMATEHLKNGKYCARADIILGIFLHCADEPQKRRNSCPQLHLNFRFGLYHATVALLFLRSCQPLLLIVFNISGFVGKFLLNLAVLRKCNRVFSSKSHNRGSR